MYSVVVIKSPLLQGGMLIFIKILEEGPFDVL